MFAEAVALEVVPVVSPVFSDALTSKSHGVLWATSEEQGGKL